MIRRKPITKENAKRYITIAGIMVLLTVVSYLTGNLSHGTDARVAEMYVCDTDKILKGATEFAITTKRLYICGTVEGSVAAQATFRLFQDEQNRHYRK